MASDMAAMAVTKASRPEFRNPHDKLAFAAHAAFLAAGFSLAAAGPAAFSDPPPSGEEEVGIDGWNQMDGRYGFVYFKNDKDKEKRVLMKCLAIGDLLAIDVLDLNAPDKEPYNVQINVKDYLSDGEEEPKNYGEMFKNFKGLIETLNSNILGKLDDEASSSGAIAKPHVESSSSARSYEGPGRIRSTELVYTSPVDPRSEPSSLVYPPVLPLDYNDAFPAPGAGFYPERGLGRGGGDLLVGPNDPRFFPSGQRPDRLGDFGNIPPGARHDPIGPPDVPGFEPSRFIRRARRPGGSTHPDLEFFQQGPDFI